MLNYLKELSLKRSAWLLLATSCLALEGTALYFQHGMGLSPCVMCIYERLALLTILVAGLIGALAPKIALLRWFALSFGLIGAFKGLKLALTHTDYQLHPAPWNQCSPFVEFPETLPLNKWFPNLFEATSVDCAEITWRFFDLTMPQWLTAIFAFYAILIILISVSQFKRTQLKSRGIFR
ncbi:disulfide bond formation protein B [Pasteurellaceae bacterium Macca]|nr:disulfide bond formation protein B [Pasteurellaceae bacterium Macca]